jgi:hypothetical protein
MKVTPPLKDIAGAESSLLKSKVIPEVVLGPIWRMRRET